MTDNVIIVDNLSKSYLVGHDSVGMGNYYALRDTIMHNVKSFIRKTSDMFRGRPIIQGDEIEEFWALKDISFVIKQGERVGIIGRNGAGKSTLLKVLSRITEPTKGKIQIAGRVASLLEVGTGFHPELTGRENIYLNGCIMGMSRKDIKIKFDQIVAFAEIERFLDTPVKRYSSGMYMRLAFAIAAHLEPEILIVDEVLAVGDLQFQKKCLGKIEDVGKEGRTVLFVSHNMAAIQSICTRVLVLKNGLLKIDSIPNEAINFYLESSKKNTFVGKNIASSIDGLLELISIDLLNSNDRLIDAAICGQSLCIRLKIKLQNKGKVTINIAIDDMNLTRVTFLSNTLVNEIIFLEPGISFINCNIPILTLTPGKYSLSVKIMLFEEVKIWAPNVIDFIVDKGDYFGSGILPEADWMGNVLINQSWGLKK